MARTGSKLISISDKDLVIMALGGSQQAFSALHAKYEKAVRGIISKVIKSPEEQEDVCMESFEKAFQKLDTFNTDMKFSTWLFTIARNNAYDHSAYALAKGKAVESTPVDLSQDSAADVADGQPSPEERVISSQDHDSFIASIEGLPDLYREVARLCLVDNLGYKEVSEQTGLPINTVKTRISRAKSQIIRKMLEDE